MILEIIALLIICFAKMTTRIDAAGMLWSAIETLTHHCNHFASLQLSRIVRSPCLSDCCHQWREVSPSPCLAVSVISLCRLPYDDFLSSAVAARQEAARVATGTGRERRTTTSMSRSIKSAVSEAALNARQ